MKAFPSLFVGLAVLSAGCSAWPDRQAPGLAGPQPLTPGQQHTNATESDRDSVAGAPAGSQERAGVSTPTLTLELEDASDRPVVGQTAARPDIWNAEFESAQRRPIQTLRVGDGDRRVLVTGSLRGDDAGSVWLLDELAARMLTGSGGVPAIRYLFLRAPNPDGLATSSPWNANGVDLNRNFPTLRYLRLSDDRSGSFPASEPETRIMLRLLADFKPDCVMQIRSARTPAIRVFVNGTAETALDESLEGLPLERGRFNEVAVSGSLQEFVSQRLQAESVTVVVPESSVRRSETIQTLLALCSAGVRVPPRTEDPSEAEARVPVAEIDPQPEPDAGPAELTGRLELIEQDGTHGFVELLPAPPESAGDADRREFYELPPPS